MRHYTEIDRANISKLLAYFLLSSFGVNPPPSEDSLLFFFGLTLAVVVAAFDLLNGDNNTIT